MTRKFDIYTSSFNVYVDYSEGSLYNLEWLNIVTFTYRVNP